MRTYGRVTDLYGNKTWVEVDTDANGNDDLVWLTTLIQVLKLSLNESPFYGQYGIPGQTAIIQQFFPDYYVALTQSFFSSYFASLIVTKEPSDTPTYRLDVVTHAGVKLNVSVPA